MRFFRSAPRVQPAQAAEADALAELYRRAWQGCERLLDARLTAHEASAPAEVTAWFVGGFEVFRVRHEGAVIGAVRCCFPSSACLIDRLAVDPDARGRGIGHLLLDHAVGRARRAGVTRIWTQVSPKLETAHALFRSFGFRDSSRFSAVYWGEDVLLLELPV
jgi:GNAT superfamily N-acetyltransferase